MEFSFLPKNGRKLEFAHALSLSRTIDLNDCFLIDMLIIVIRCKQGDLARKKIYPTIWWLYRDNLLPKNTIFYGYARSHMKVEEVRAKSHQYMKVKEEEQERYEAFWEANRYFAGGYDSRRDFEMLDQEMIQHERGPAANRLFYLAVPPFVFESVTANIRSSCMASKYKSFIN